MDTAEIQKQLDELEPKAEQLRALYEQYFMGIERLEPLFAKRDVERRIKLLRREQIRNTAQRFKFNTLVQRFNLMQQHWARVVREIESGTYRRDVMRAAARFGSGAIGALGRQKKGLGLDVAEEPGSASPAEARREAPAADESFELGADDLIEEVDDLDDAPTPGPKPVAAPRPSAPMGNPVLSFGELVGVPVSAGSPAGVPVSAGSPAGVPVSAGSPAGVEAPEAAPVAPPVPEPPKPVPRQVGGLSALSAASRAAGPGASGLRIGGGPVAPPPKQDPSDVKRRVAELAAQIASRRGGGDASAAAVSSLGETPKPPPQALSLGEPRKPPPAPSFGEIDLAFGGEPQAPPKASAPAVRPLPSPAPKPAPPAAPAVAPAIAAAGAARHGSLDDGRIRQIYAKYVETKRATQESTASVTFDKLAASLRAQADKLRAAHPNRAVDYEVVVKDGKTHLKPVLR